MSLSGDSRMDDVDAAVTLNTSQSSEQDLWDDCLLSTTDSSTKNVGTFESTDAKTAVDAKNVNNCGVFPAKPIFAADFVPNKKAVGKFKFLANAEADSSMNSAKIETSLNASTLYNGILDDTATPAVNFVDSLQQHNLSVDSAIELTIKVKKLEFNGNVEQCEAPPPPPPPPKRGRGRPCKNPNKLQVTSGPPPGLTVSSKKMPNRLNSLSTVAEIVDAVARCSTTPTSAPPPPPLPPGIVVKPPQFLPHAVVQKKPLKKAILSDMQQQIVQSSTPKTPPTVCVKVESCSFTESTTSEAKNEQRATTPSRSVGFCLPTTPDTGLKLKSRWYQRSEQETPSSTTATAPSELNVTFENVCLPPFATTATPSPFVHQATPIDAISSSDSRTDQEIKPTPPVPPNFEQVQDNIYYSSDKKQLKKGKSARMICECCKEDAVKSGVGCGEECLNRILYYECGSNCPCGNLCTNRRFQKHQYANVEPFHAGAKGFGLRAVQFVPKHSFVLEYVGEVLSSSQFENRKKQYSKDPAHSHHYFMALKTDQIIDATRKGSVSRFINHSCEPNCETQKWTVGGQLRIGFFTIRDVQAGEEMTFDYRFQRYGKEAQKCLCGTPSCRGFIDGGEAKTRVYVEKEEKKRERERTVFEDTLFDREFEDAIAVGCLRNKDQVVTFGRLMLRAEDYDSRRQLLDLLLKTESNVLRLFVDLHGCRLLWSWTVDEEACGDNWLDLQLQMLDVFCMLPIPHKNMLQESRLLSTVERWARMHRRPTHLDKNDIDDEVKATVRSLIDSVCAEFESDGSPESSSVDDDVYNKQPISSFVNIEERFTEVQCKSQRLLEQWSSLKENFKIPKKLEKKEEKNEIVVVKKEKESSRKSSHESKKDKSTKSSNKSNKKVADRKKSEDKSSKSHSTSRSRSRSKSKSKDSRIAAYNYLDYGFNIRRSPSHHSTARKRAHSRENESADSESHKRSKEERRRVFEENAAREEEKKLYDRHLKEFESLLGAEEKLDTKHHHRPSAAHNRYWDGHASIGSTPLSAADATGVPIHVPTAVAPPQPAAAPTNPAAFPAVFVHDANTGKYWWRDQTTGVLVYPANEQQVMAMLSGDNTVVPHFYSDPLSGLIHEVQVRMQVSAPAVAPNFNSNDDRMDIDMMGDDEAGLPREHRITILREQIASLQNQLDQKQNELKWLLEQEESESSLSPLNERPPSTLPPDWRVATDAEGRFYYYHVVTKQTQWEPPTVYKGVSPPQSMRKPSSPKRLSLTSSSTSKVHLPAKKPSEQQQQRRHHGDRRKDRVEQQRKMKAALKIKNAAFPKKSSNKAHSTSAKLSAMHKKEQHRRMASSTSTKQPRPSSSSANSKEHVYEEASSNVTPFGTTTAAADTSSEVARKLKEGFKAAISNHVIKYLNSYRKSDCKAGHISNNEDFKHLARKLTHAVMEKELKHCNRVEDLHVTDSVLHKAKDYIKRYMVKLGPIYKRSATSP